MTPLLIAMLIAQLPETHRWATCVAPQPFRTLPQQCGQAYPTYDDCVRKRTHLEPGEVQGYCLPWGRYYWEVDAGRCPLVKVSPSVTQWFLSCESYQ